jgi:nucleoporin SEH1
MPQILHSEHQDYIHDIAFDHYGRRIATCSGDRTVKIWDLDENGEWTTTEEQGNEWKKVHRGSITSVSWGHPEFGQLLATSGSDNFAIVWEETAESMGARNSAPTKWKDKAKLIGSQKSLSCVKFAPRHLRLQIATGSADGTVRIYEADGVMNLDQWVLRHEIHVDTDEASDLGVTCLDWCSGRFEPPTLVAGDSSGNVNIYRYYDASEKWALHENLKLDGHISPRRGTLDVAWSPDIGRSYHLIGSCGRDGVLRVHRLKKGSGKSGQEGDSNKGSGLQLESSQKLETDSDTWRCAWNVTGTVLASSGDLGVVKLWKSDFKGVWKCVADVHGTVRDQAAVNQS